MARGFSCHKKGHVAASGWPPMAPQQNALGHWYIMQTCRHCCCIYVEYLPGAEATGVLDASGKELIGGLE